MIGRLKGWLQGGVAPADLDRKAGALAELRVLMVCTGNICRSPTAEAVLRDRLVRAGLAGRVAVASAGTQGYHTGEGPDPRAVKAAAARGYDLRGLRARPMLPADFTQFHLLLAMDEDHLVWMQRKAPPGMQARIDLLMPHSRRFAGLRNVHVAVHEDRGTIVFLHRVEAGPAEHSYGIQVGRLAGLPASVLRRLAKPLGVGV